jgi:hypothetical protein
LKKFGGREIWESWCGLTVETNENESSTRWGLTFKGDFCPPAMQNIEEPLFKIYNDILKTGEIPTQLKKSNTIFLKKKTRGSTSL